MQQSLGVRSGPQQSAVIVTWLIFDVWYTGWKDPFPK